MFKYVLVEYKHAEVKVRPSMSFFSFDLDSMTLILKVDLDMIKMCLYTENGSS